MFYLIVLCIAIYSNFLPLLTSLHKILPTFWSVVVFVVVIYRRAPTRLVAVLVAILVINVNWEGIMSILP